MIHGLRPVRLLDDDVGLREALVHVTFTDGGVLEEVVVAVVDKRGVRGERRLNRKHARKRLVLDHDAIDRRLGQIFALGGDERDRVADAAHLSLGQYALVENRHAITIRAGDVLVRQHRMDARHGLRCARIDSTDERMGVRAPQDLRVQHARQRHVARVDGLAGDFLPRIQPRGRRTDQALRRPGVDGDHDALRAGTGALAACIARAAERTAAVILL